MVESRGCIPKESVFMVKIQVVETLHSTNAFKGTEGSSQ
jgi:hypothetical protein